MRTGSPGRATNGSVMGHTQLSASPWPIALGGKGDRGHKETTMSACAEGHDATTTTMRVRYGLDGLGAQGQSSLELVCMGLW